MQFQKTPSLKTFPIFSVVTVCARFCLNNVACSEHHAEYEGKTMIRLNILDKGIYLDNSKHIKTTLLKRTTTY